MYFLYRLDGKHVVFGKIVSGIDVLNSIESCGSMNGKPKHSVIVSDCGVLEEAKKEANKH
jgi:peptidylprolyl isomerase